MDLDLKSVKLFVRVAALGAIGRAGAEFGLSATAATQRVRALEEAVGAQLLHRTTRAVSLSADGEVFLAHAKRIVSNVEDAFADLQGDPDAMSGELRIASSASLISSGLTNGITAVPRSSDGLPVEAIPAS